MKIKKQTAVLLSSLLFSCATTSFAEVQINREECEGITFDHTQRFGPDTDMGVTEFCWVHAVAALMEEHICLSDSKLCGQNISRSAIAAASNQDKPILMNKLKMGSIHKTLQKVLEQGQVCLKKFAADPESKLFDETLKESQILFAHLKKSKYGLQTTPHPDEPVKSEQLQSYFNQAILKFPNSEEFQKGYFFQEILLANCEVKNLVKFKNQFGNSIQKDFYIEKEVEVRIVTKIEPDHPKELKTERKKERFPKPESNAGRLKILAEAKTLGRSTILEVCTRDLSSSLLGHNILTHFGYSDEMCGGHAVIINAAKWNGEKNRCELHMQNFWGKAPKLLPTNWYNADQVLQSSTRIHYIK